MTRVNFGVSVRRLTDEHLLAEHREIKRIPGAYLTALRSGSIDKTPKKFCLGRGHILFFIDKPGYTLRRYMQIYRECLRRGFDVQSYAGNWSCYSEGANLKTVRATDADRAMLITRISERIKSSPKRTFHYYGEPLSKRDAIRLLYGGIK